MQADGATGELTIEAGSLDTGHDRRDRHLRSPAFFDVERHPRIVFAATAVTARAGGPIVTGRLAIGSARVALEIPVAIEHAPDSALRLEGKTTVARTAAGLAWNKLGMIRGDAMLRAHITFTRVTT